MPLVVAKLHHRRDRPAGGIEIGVKLTIGQAFGRLRVVQLGLVHVVAGDAPLGEHHLDSDLRAGARLGDADTLAFEIAQSELTLLPLGSTRCRSSG